VPFPFVEESEFFSKLLRRVGVAAPPEILL
jgi:hypothetical protein